MGQEILKMSLQPIIENAVKYGLRDKQLTIGIQAQVTGELMVIEIMDDGAGMSQERVVELNRRIGMEEERAASAVDAASNPLGMPSGGSGIGLLNVQRRIRMHYGREYGLHMESIEGQYTRVMIHIPCIILSGGIS
jgi:two-component system sensor histidine kinase YesM